MSRVYVNYQVALKEIQRDVYKGSKVSSTRVQSMVNQELVGREITGYTYTILGDFPVHPEEVVAFSADVLNLKIYQDHGPEIVKWLYAEKEARLNPEAALLHKRPSDDLHPALKKVQEGGHYGYTYPERLLGAKASLTAAIVNSPDSRRAFWPIFRPEDAIRAGSATRVPCSISYEILLRTQPGKDDPELWLFYIERSADFDTFVPTDIWLARQFQIMMAEELGYEPGPLQHYIVSLHSFTVENTEIY